MNPQIDIFPTAEDHAVAEKLHAEGWIQVSAKYRIIRRWAAAPPVAHSLIVPEMRDTAWGRRMAAAFKRWCASESALHREHAAWDTTLYGEQDAPRRTDAPGLLHPDVKPNPLIEERTLTIGEFKALKAQAFKARYTRHDA